MNLHIKLLEDKIIEILKPTKKELIHGQETVKWLNKLYPEAPWEIEIAALAHDIERAVPDIPNMTPPKINKIDNEDYSDWKARHAQRSAVIVEHLMRTYLFNDSQIQIVKSAIAEHDTMNKNNKDKDLDSNNTYIFPEAGSVAVCDADSARFFDSGLPNYIHAYGLESAKIKAKDMYSRCTAKTKRIISNIDFNKEVKKSLGILP